LTTVDSQRRLQKDDIGISIHAMQLVFLWKAESKRSREEGEKICL